MQIRTFSLHDIRCFAGWQKFTIRPLTFLVGENSTGKSTVLGCFQALGEFISSHFQIDFNQNPYQMGSYQEIVRKGRPLKTSFQMGFRIERQSIPIDYIATLIERQGGSEPVIAAIEWRFSNGSIIFQHSNENSSVDGTVKLSVESQESGPVFTITIGGNYGSWFARNFREVLFLLNYKLHRKSSSDVHQQLRLFFSKKQVFQAQRSP